MLLGGTSSGLIKLPVKGQCNGHFDQRGNPFLICAILVKDFFPYFSKFNRKLLAVPYCIVFTLIVF